MNVLACRNDENAFCLSKIYHLIKRFNLKLNQNQVRSEIRLTSFQCLEY